MQFGFEERKHYHFPSQTNVINFERDAHLYFPSKEDEITREINSYKEDKLCTKQSYGEQRGILS